MPLTAGTRLGPYEIVSPLGAGGMGEVYRARDTKLNRDVAMKVLPEVFASDPERLARFRREAQVLALLNHTNIGAIYGLEDSDGTHALVLELVEGPTLADRIAHGPLPLDEALPIAKQIADALDAAHEQGIIHRDLKPANVKVRSDGTVKVLDFGLAKALTPDLASAGDFAQSPTLSDVATRPGIVLGTASYMSPEQARGKPVDKRADIWAFGSVLYEMLTGRLAFAGDTITDTMAMVLGVEPEWHRLPQTTPATVRRLLKRCLEKDSRRRLHDIADARIEIDDALLAPTPAASHSERLDSITPPATGVRTWRNAALGLGAFALVAGGFAVRGLFRLPAGSPNGEIVRFAIHLQPSEQFPIDTGLPVVLAISPRGDQVVYAARDVVGDRLHLQRRNDLEASSIPGTEGAIGPFFSPDGQWLGFASGGVLRAVPIAGGAPRRLAEAPNFDGASWGPDDTIVFSPQWNSGLFKVSARGGKPEPVTLVDEAFRSPHVLPDGKTVLCSVLRGGESFLEAVDTTTGRQLRLVEGRNPMYLPSGHIVFARGSSLFAVPFDVARLEITGVAVRLLDAVRSDGNDTHFAVAHDGTLVYVPEVGGDSRLVWFDRHGNSRPLDNEPRRYSHPRISPDGTRVVLTLPRESGGNEIWIYDAARGQRTRLSPSGPVSRPIWSPDGKRIIFQQAGDLYSVPADDSSAPELTLKRDDQFRTNVLFPLAWSRNGRVLAFSVPDDVTNRDVWTLQSGGPPTPFLATPRDERAAMFSPEGGWVVYAAKETGREEQIFVQPYPGPGSRLAISPTGGIEPMWSPTGREIFYRSVDGTRLMSVDVRPAGSSLATGTPRGVLAGRFADPGGSYWSNYDVSRDGQEFLMLAVDRTSTPQLNVVINWAAALNGQ